MTYKALAQQFGIGLTGGIACGKSTIAGILRADQWPVIDADQLARDVVAPEMPALAEIARHFGESYLNPDGSLDRPKMRQLIFSDEHQKEVLEQIIHPRLQQAAIDQLQSLGVWGQPRIWFYEASLIFERNLAGQFRETWVASCPKDVQLQRLMDRDQMSENAAQQAIRNQWPTERKARLATRVIDTNCSKQELTSRVHECLKQLERTSFDKK